jgi:hypothetical protein
MRFLRYVLWHNTQRIGHSAGPLFKRVGAFRPMAIKVYASAFGGEVYNRETLNITP